MSLLYPLVECEREREREEGVRRWGGNLGMDH